MPETASGGRAPGASVDQAHDPSTNLFRVEPIRSSPGVTTRLPMCISRAFRPELAANEGIRQTPEDAAGP